VEPLPVENESPLSLSSQERETKKGDALIGDIAEFVRLYHKLDESIAQKQR